MPEFFIIITSKEHYTFRHLIELCLWSKVPFQSTQMCTQVLHISGSVVVQYPHRVLFQATLQRPVTATQLQPGIRVTTVALYSICSRFNLFSSGKRANGE